jgi:allantoinase
VRRGRRLLGRRRPGNLADLRALHDAGVFGFKCFLVHSGVDEFPPLSARS